MTQFAKRAAATPKTPPKYASKVAGLYSKACSCIGVKPCTTTLRALTTTVTKVITNYKVATATSQVTASTILPLTASTTLTTTVLTASDVVDVTDTATVSYIAVFGLSTQADYADSCLSQNDVTVSVTQTVTLPVSTVRICTAATPTFSVIAKSDDPNFQYNGQYPTSSDGRSQYAWIVGWTNDNSNSATAFKFYINGGKLYQQYNFGNPPKSSGAFFVTDVDSDSDVVQSQNFNPDGVAQLQCGLSAFDGTRQTLQCNSGRGATWYWCGSGSSSFAATKPALYLFDPSDARTNGCQAITLTALC